MTTLNWQKLNSIEAVERKAARFCKNCWNREPRTVTRLIQELNWEPLQMRREGAKLMLFFKISRGLVAIQMPSYFQPLRYCRTRQYHPVRYIAELWHQRVQGEFLPRHDKLVEQPTLWIDYSAKPQRLQGWPGQFLYEWIYWFSLLIFLTLSCIFCLFCIIIIIIIIIIIVDCMNNVTLSTCVFFKLHFEYSNSLK